MEVLVNRHIDKGTLRWRNDRLIPHDIPNLYIVDPINKRITIYFTRIVNHYNYVGQDEAICYVKGFGLAGLELYKLKQLKNYCDLCYYTVGEIDASHGIKKNNVSLCSKCIHYYEHVHQPFNVYEIVENPRVSIIPGVKKLNGIVRLPHHQIQYLY